MLFVLPDTTINSLVEEHKKPILISLKPLPHHIVKDMIATAYEAEGCNVCLPEDLYYKFTEDLDIDICFNLDETNLLAPEENSTVLLVSIHNGQIFVTQLKSE